ncbi:MAG TPA: DUF3187 family protein [Burkholderiales bacterium]
MSIAALRRLFLAAVSIAPTPSFADWFDPLPTFNQSPLAQIYGLPTPDAARVLNRGQYQARVSLEAANNFLSVTSANESLELDGETHRASVVFKTATANGEWGIEIPYLSHSGGSLDDFIDDWHQFLGLPRGGRENAPVGRLQFIYTRDGVDRLRVTDASSGIGDIRLLAGWKQPDRDTTDRTLRASLKLPTGNAAQLHGSGAADFALWLSAACAIRSCGGTVAWNAHAGALLLGRGDVLSEQQRRLVAFGGGGLAYRPWQPTVFKAELRAHSPFYRGTSLKPLGVSSFQLILGGTLIVGEDVAVDIGVTEDIRSETAPDVSLLLSIRANF